MQYILYDVTSKVKKTKNKKQTAVQFYIFLAEHFISMVYLKDMESL